MHLEITITPAPDGSGARVDLVLRYPVEEKRALDQAHKVGGAYVEQLYTYQKDLDHYNETLLPQHERFLKEQWEPLQPKRPDREELDAQWGATKHARLHQTLRWIDELAVTPEDRAELWASYIEEEERIDKDAVKNLWQSRITDYRDALANYKDRTPKPPDKPTPPPVPPNAILFKLPRTFPPLPKTREGTLRIMDFPLYLRTQLPEETPFVEWPNDGLSHILHSYSFPSLTSARSFAHEMRDIIFTKWQEFNHVYGHQFPITIEEIEDEEEEDVLPTLDPALLTNAVRRQHWMVVAPTGSGKTQLLQERILQDIHSPEAPSLVIIDNKGVMLDKIQHLKVLENTDRLIILDPTDDVPPALNLFHNPNPRLGSYSRFHREAIEADTIDLINFVLQSLSNEYTPKQQTLFTFATRLMLATPNASLARFRQLMEDSPKRVEDSQFYPTIQTLDPTAQDFFRSQFFSSAYKETRQQVAQRLYLIVKNRSIELMLDAPENRLDMYDALQSGKIILVHTATSLLKQDAASLYGRIMISKVLSAVYERIVLDDDERHPTYLIVDEADLYFSSQIDEILSRAREYNLGIMFAIQRLTNMKDRDLRSSVMANTTIKTAGHGMSVEDARALSGDMRVSAEQLLQLIFRERVSSDWAFYIKGQPTAAIHTVPFGWLEAQPRMSEAAWRAMRQRNRERYGVRPVTRKPPPITPPINTPSGGEIW